MNEIFNNCIDILFKGDFVKKDQEKMSTLLKMVKKLNNSSFEDILLRSAIVIPKTKDKSISWLNFMLQNGVKPKMELWQKYENQSAFVVAIREGSVEAVKLFLDNGLELEKNSPVIAVLGASSLEFEDKVKLFYLFIEKKPDLDIDVSTNMFNERSYYNGFGQAYSKKDIKFAKFLLEKGVSIKGSYTVYNDGIEDFVEEYKLDRNMDDLLKLEEKYQIVKDIVVKRHNIKQKI